MTFKITLERDALHAALGRVARIVERRTTIPILSHLLLVAEGEGVTIRATDLDIEATTRVAAKVETAGRATIAAGLIAEIVGKLPSGAQVRLEPGIPATEGLSPTTLVLKSGRSRLTLHTLPPGDFPDIGADDATVDFDLEPATLLALIGKTEFAISNEETRYYLNGIFLHVLDVDGRAMLRAVATDGHRLARWQGEAPAGADGAALRKGVIVPRKVVAEIKRLAKDAGGPVSLAIDDRRLRVAVPNKVGTTILRGKLIDGTFPDYQRVIPRDNGRRAVLPREAAIEATARVACISTERGRAVRLSFDDDRLVLAVTNPDAGSAADEIDVGYAAAPIEVGFNAAYLGEILGVLDGERVHLDLADPGSPALFREAGDPTSPADALLLVLMPMRV